MWNFESLRGTEILQNLQSPRKNYIPMCLKVNTTVEKTKKKHPELMSEEIASLSPAGFQFTINYQVTLSGNILKTLHIGIEWKFHKNMWFGSS